MVPAGVDQVFEQHPELRAPVAEVVDADDVVAERIVKIIERVAEHGGAQVKDAEFLGDVRRGIVDDNCFSPARVGRAEALTALEDFREGLADEGVMVDEKVEVRPPVLDALDEVAAFEPGGQVGGDGRRILLFALCNMSSTTSE